MLDKDIEIPLVVNEWDSVILQINLGDAGCGAIKMMKQDILEMMASHNAVRSDILEMMLLAVETTPKDNFASVKES